jgi:hypothetical protein
VVATVAPDVKRPEPPRDQWGRYLLPIPGTDRREGHTRATTIAGTLKDGFALGQWAERMTAKGMSLRPDLVALAASIDPDKDDGKKELNKIVEQAKETAGSSRGANFGTALHGFTEALDRGEPITPPAQLEPDIDAYRRTLDAHGIQTHPWWVERILYHPERFAGTADRLLWLPGWDRPVIGDLKTGGFLAYDEIAMQLAIYARAPYWFDAATDTFGSTVDVGIDPDRALVIHLPVGKATCTLVWVDIARGWQMVELAEAVREWRKAKDIASTFEAAS